MQASAGESPSRRKKKRTKSQKHLAHEAANASPCDCCAATREANEILEADGSVKIKLLKHAGRFPHYAAQKGPHYGLRMTDRIVEEARRDPTYGAQYKRLERKGGTTGLVCEAHFDDLWEKCAHHKQTVINNKERKAAELKKKHKKGEAAAVMKEVLGLRDEIREVKAAPAKQKEEHEAAFHAWRASEDERQRKEREERRRLAEAQAEAERLARMAAERDRMATERATRIGWCARAKNRVAARHNAALAACVSFGAARSAALAADAAHDAALRAFCQREAGQRTQGIHEALVHLGMLRKHFAVLVSELARAKKLKEDEADGNGGAGAKKKRHKSQRQLREEAEAKEIARMNQVAPRVPLSILRGKLDMDGILMGCGPGLGGQISEVLEPLLEEEAETRERNKRAGKKVDKSLEHDAGTVGWKDVRLALSVVMPATSFGDDIELLLKLTKLFVARQQWEQARDMSARVMRKLPKAPEPLISHALALAHLGEVEKAFELAEKAHRMAPRNPLVVDRRRIIHELKYAADAANQAAEVAPPAEVAAENQVDDTPQQPEDVAPAADEGDGADFHAAAREAAAKLEQQEVQRRPSQIKPDFEDARGHAWAELQQGGRKTMVARKTAIRMPVLQQRAELDRQAEAAKGQIEATVKFHLQESGELKDAAAMAQTAVEQSMPIGTKSMLVQDPALLAEARSASLAATQMGDSTRSIRSNSELGSDSGGESPMRMRG